MHAGQYTAEEILYFAKKYTDKEISKSKEVKDESTGLLGSDAVDAFEEMFPWDSDLASVSTVRIAKGGYTVSIYVDFIPAVTKSSTYSLLTASSANASNKLSVRGCPVAPVFDGNNSPVGYYYMLSEYDNQLNIRIYPSTTLTAGQHYYFSMTYVSRNSTPLS